MKEKDSDAPLYRFWWSGCRRKSWSVLFVTLKVLHKLTQLVVKRPWRLYYSWTYISRESLKTVYLKIRNWNSRCIYEELRLCRTSKARKELFSDGRAFKEQRALNLLEWQQLLVILVVRSKLSKVFKDKKGNLVICTKDSVQTRLKKSKQCEYYEIPLFSNLKQDELSLAIGKRRSIVLVDDRGFTKSLLKMKGFNDMNE